MLVAPSTTWLLVRISPAEVTMIPVPAAWPDPSAVWITVVDVDHGRVDLGRDGLGIDSDGDAGGVGLGYRCDPRVRRHRSAAAGDDGGGAHAQSEDADHGQDGERAGQSERQEADAVRPQRRRWEAIVCMTSKMAAPPWARVSRSWESAGKPPRCG